MKMCLHVARLKMSLWSFDAVLCENPEAAVSYIKGKYDMKIDVCRYSQLKPCPRSENNNYEEEQLWFCLILQPLIWIQNKNRNKAPELINSVSSKHRTQVQIKERFNHKKILFSYK